MLRSISFFLLTHNPKWRNDTSFIVTLFYLLIIYLHYYEINTIRCQNFHYLYIILCLYFLDTIYITKTTQNREKRKRIEIITVTGTQTVI